MKKILILLFLSGILIDSFAQESINQRTTFKFGGYVKGDLIHSCYMNGDVGGTSPLRDFHLPSQIPVGETNVNYVFGFNNEMADEKR